MSRARDLADGTFSGAFSADSPTLVVDATTNRVGIGASSPAQPLDVSGNVKSTGQFLAGSTGSATPDYSFTADNTLGMFRAPGVLGFSVGGTERARIDSSGRVTTPYQPAFHAYISGSNPGFGSTPAKIPYNATRFNVGNNYDTTNQRFVAPVDGRYLFLNCLSVYYITAGLWFRNLWYVNGSNWKVGAYEVSADGNQDQQIESTLLIDLDANDYVEVWVQSTDTSFYMSAGTPYGAFSGYLVG